MKKYWWIGIALIFTVITLAVSGVLLKQKGEEENKANDVVKIDESLYYKSLDDEQIIFDKENGQRVSNELIIYADDTDRETIETYVNEEKGEIVGYIEITNTYQIEFDTSITVEELRAKKNNLEKNNHIELVSYNHVLQASSYSAFYPNDERWKYSWDDMESGNWGLKAINVPEAWDYIKTQEENLREIQMGIFEVDPLNSEHEDLKANLGEIFGYIDKKEQKRSELNHGTQVVGVIGAVHNNGRDYNSTFEWEDRLYLNLLNLTDSDVTTVPYKVEICDGQNPLQMTLTLENAQTSSDKTPLCGMEKIMVGTYEKLSFSKEQLETIKTDLGVPKDMDVVIVQNPPYYWEPGQSWLTHVVIYDKSNHHLAEATFYSKTAELCRGMIKYAG